MTGHGSPPERIVLGPDLLGEGPRARQAANRGAVFEPPAPPSSRVLVTLTATLAGSIPPIWRTIEVVGDADLSEVHQVLQAAFSWEDRHLYRFSLTEDPLTGPGPVFLCPDDASETPEEGLRAASVRLDQAVQKTGDHLYYLYDYGDNWEIDLHVDSLKRAHPETPRARCIAGEGAAPLEDSGGIPGFDLFKASRVGRKDFSLARINETLAATVNDPLGSDLIAFVNGERENTLTERLLCQYPGVENALEKAPTGDGATAVLFALLQLGQPAEQVSQEDLEQDFAGLLWLLKEISRLGGKVKLTSSGYLPPHLLRAWLHYLPHDRHSPASFRSEADLPEMWALRKDLQRLGFLRRSKEDLVLTKAGKKAVRSPSAAWRHLATRLHPATRADGTEDLETLLLLFAAAGAGQDPYRSAAAAADGLGWEAGSRPITRGDLIRLGRNPIRILTYLGQSETEHQAGDPPLQRELSRTAQLLARAALAE